MQNRILVVEDNYINREMLIEILSDQYQVLEAENGQVALEILMNGQDDIALILLDIMMPVMDGYTFLEKMKKVPELAAIPVIVMTQGDSEDDEVAALSHGATDFLPKPYRPQIILHRVENFINFRETAAMANQFKYDRLTGLYSKGFFCQRVREVLLQNPEREYDIICSNIENFKLFNDAFGVQAGDRLLCEIAKYFNEKGKEQEFFGRLNADRFVCLRERKEVYHEENFQKFGEQINDLSNAKNVILKWGIYRIEDRSVSIEQMCDRVLLAADSIKGQYHKCVAVYDDALRDKLLREQAIMEEMETALKEGQFTVYLQPKYSLNDDGLAGAEALVRWNHPERGFISPAEFVPVFEKNDFITQMDCFVWDRACALLREWRDKGYPRISLSVNVSRADFYQTNLVDILLGMVKKYNLSPADLHLEITESAYTENPAQILSAVEKLRQHGFVLEMDDFGSGYSSLNMLNQMKLDIIKLDMKFIQSETAKPANQGILRFIVDLAHWMNLSVVAEGVETREQLVRLREIGCDYAQGYFFAKPMSSQEFEKKLKEQYKKEETLPIQHSFTNKNTSCILIVDEDTKYRNAVKCAFQKMYDVLEAVDERSARTHITEQKNLICIAIVSMTLPEHGGMELLKFLNEDPSSWRIPVLATGVCDSEMEKAAFRFGADDFAWKSQDVYSLKKRVERLLGLMTYHERERQLQDEVFRDYLTGLLNRRGLHASVNALKQEDLPVALYFFDLDNLKKTNDCCGHEVGDHMLQIFGELLRQCSRSTDIVARYGGDEFVMIMKRIPSKEFALKKGKEICCLFRQFQMSENIFAACSVGVAICGVNEKPSAQLFKRADQALYRAKSQNKGGCCMWDERIDGSEC